MSTFRHILKLNPAHQQTRRAVADAHTMHQAVMDGFDHLLPNRDFMADGVKPHPTHRADHNILHAVDTRPNGEVWVMVQADQPGDWGRSRIADALMETPLAVEHNPAASGHIHYQIVANAVKRDNQTRKLHPLTNPADVEQWWRRRAADIGLDLTDRRVDILGSTLLKSRTKRGLTVRATRIGGTGTVTDKDAFADALTQGIGKGKAYGCGLLLTLPGNG